MSKDVRKSQGIVSWPEEERPRERLLSKGAQALTDSASIRRTALTMKVPYYTTMAGAAAATEAIGALRAGSLEVAPLQSYSLSAPAPSVGKEVQA